MFYSVLLPCWALKRLGGCGSGGSRAVPALSPHSHRVPIRFLRSEILNTQYGSLYMPSTGALMLLTALHTCDQVRPHRATVPSGRRESPLWLLWGSSVSWWLSCTSPVPEGSGGGDGPPEVKP